MVVAAVPVRWLVAVPALGGALVYALYKRVVRKKLEERRLVVRVDRKASLKASAPHVGG